MTPERWQRINDIFHAALDLDPALRGAYTRAQAGDDTEIAREVESLLDSHRRSNGVLDLPAWAVGADLLLDDEPALAGKIVGKYRIVREIARGGMGVVYLARDQVLDRAVALKSLPMEYSEDPARRERLAREAMMAAQLEHRAIATVYELQEFEGQVFIASEYVNGVTLRRELEDGPLPPGHLLGTLIEIAAALAAAHTRNIVHRDLKPENIIRREDGQIKVLDFGLAKRVTGSNLTSTRLTQPGIIAGTPGYMAPEVLGNKEADARSDIFVFGVIAWELATGKHPFGNHPNSQMARLHDLTAGNEVKLPGPLTTPGLDAVVRRCLRRLPKDRYDTADALLHDLRKLQTHDAVVHVVAAPGPAGFVVVAIPSTRHGGSRLGDAGACLAGAGVGGAAGGNMGVPARARDGDRIGHAPAQPVMDIAHPPFDRRPASPAPVPVDSHRGSAARGHDGRVGHRDRRPARSHGRPAHQSGDRHRRLARRHRARHHS